MIIASDGVCFTENNNLFKEEVMSKVGGLKHKYYKETKGMKVSGGQFVKSGTVLTRQGYKWKPGLHVNGLSHLTAGCDGEVYFTKKRGNYKRAVTYINIKPVAAKKKK